MTDYTYINPTGTVIPDTSVILGEVQQEYKDTFEDENLVVTADTPQGMLIAADTLTRTDVVTNNAALANQINPNLAGGVFLDAIIALLGTARTAATRTVVTGVTLTGVASTVISAGSQAKTAAGDIFETISNVTIGAGGTITATFRSVAYGAIPCAENALDTIVSNVLGWETVDNPTAGVLGTSTQSDQAARAYRQNTLGFQGVALAVAQTSALYNVEGVKSLQFLENYNSEPMGMLVHVTNGATLADTLWGLTTTGDIVVGTDEMAFAASTQTLPSSNPWPVAKYATKTGNVTLSGLSTQTQGDWAGSLTIGDFILVKSQTDPTENGVWVAASGSWTRQAYNTAASTILGSNLGISLTKNSVWTCVDGGTDLDVASALLENKSSGAAWNGGTDITVTEPASEQDYTVKFDRPTVIPILIKVTTTNGSTNNIKQVIVDYANGLLNGLQGFVVGADVSPFEISGAIMSTYPSYFVQKVEISKASPLSYTTDNIVIGLNEIAYTQSSYITVVVS